MKIIKLTKPENANQQLKDLAEGDSVRQDFEISLEDNPDGKYIGKLIITKMSEENQGKPKRRFAIKKLKPI